MQKSNTRLCLYLTLTLTVALLGGCADAPGCAWVKPIYPAKSEQACFTRGTKQQIVIHNETWEQTTK